MPLPVQAYFTQKLGGAIMNVGATRGGGQFATLRQQVLPRPSAAQGSLTKFSGAHYLNPAPGADVWSNQSDTLITQMTRLIQAARTETIRTLAPLPPKLPRRGGEYIQSIEHPMTVQPWSPTRPVPPGWRRINAWTAINPGEARQPRQEGVFQGSGFGPSDLGELRRPTPADPSQDVSRKPRVARPARPPRPPRAPRAPREPRLSRWGRTSRASRPSRPSRPPRAAREARPPRGPGRKGYTDGGVCKVSAPTGGCWNTGVCLTGYSATGTFGHCMFIATPRCSACMGGACGGALSAFQKALRMLLPKEWFAPLKIPTQEELAAQRTARRQRRVFIFPPDAVPLRRGGAPGVPDPRAPQKCGCQRSGRGFNANALVPWSCAADPLVQSGLVTGTAACPPGVTDPMWPS